jgi:hypothetical protein
VLDQLGRLPNLEIDAEHHHPEGEPVEVGARAFYAEKLGLEPGRGAPRARSRVRGRSNVPGMNTVDGIAEVQGNYPSQGGKGERAAWFRDSEGNLLGIGQKVA